ncbi:MAG: cation diffusion facilitator family transporter [Pseudomonadales bacterium]
MAHQHHDHQHPHQHGTAGQHERLVARAFLLIAGFMVVEIAGGLFANSLTLLADAGHMFLDASALGFSWYALRLSRRGHDRNLSYGYHRYQVLATFINGLTLFALIVWILLEAWERLQNPEGMLPVPALAVAVVGLIVNVVAFRWLHHGHDNATVRSAALHVIGDMLGSAAAIIAALTVWLTGWLYADPLLALVIVAILGRGAWRLVRDSSHILLEGVPRDLDLREISATLTARVPGVREVHHLHAWALTAERPLLTLHATVDEDTDLGGVVTQIKTVLNDDFGIDHSTIQVEHGPCPDD